MVNDPGKLDCNVAAASFVRHGSREIPIYLHNWVRRVSKYGTYNKLR